MFIKGTETMKVKTEAPAAYHAERDALAAPAVQDEPVAWVTADTVDGRTVNGKPRRIWWENKEGVGIPIYAAPQPAPDVAALVEALEAMVDRYAPNYHDCTDDGMPECEICEARAALAAHRKQQEPSHERTTD